MILLIWETYCHLLLLLISWKNNNMPQSQTQKSCSHPIFENKNVALMALARLPKYIRKNLARQIQKNLRSINRYSYNKLSKIGKFHTFFSFFLVLFSWLEWFRSCFTAPYKTFSNISHQLALREAWPNMASFFSKLGLEKQLFVLRPFFSIHYLTLIDICNVLVIVIDNILI